MTPPAAASGSAPARWRVWLLASGQRTPVAPADAALGPILVAAAGGALLAIGEGRPWPALLTPPIALVGHLLVDRLGAFHLPALVANLLGLGAAALALTELGSGEIEARLLFGAHLLVYLTWIISLQRKTFKVCWSLVALTVLQVAVASVLTAGAKFGIGLAGFLALTLWALANLSARWPDADRRTLRPPSRAALAAARALPTGRTSVALAGRVGADGARLPGRTVAAVLGTAAVIGAALFLLTPRIWLSRRPPIDPTRTGGVSAAYTGFSGEVRLGALGEILESSEPAFEVEVESIRQGLSLQNSGVMSLFGVEEPLFRGRALDRYQDGRWIDSLDAIAEVRSLPPTPPPLSQTATIERYRLRPLGDEVLIHAGRADALQLLNAPRERAKRRTVDDLVERAQGVPVSAEVEYVVYTKLTPASELPAGNNGRASARAQMRPLRTPLVGELRRRYLQRPGQLPAVTAAAEAVLLSMGPGEPSKIGEADGAAERAGRPNAKNDADAPPLRRVGRGRRAREVAERMTAYLQDSGEFSYSLDLSVDDPTVDAVEDFLANKRVGHCEYFASALALMLRDVGIPSRVVTGFKGGNLNGTTGQLEVQQRHAHAWVEAHVAGRWETFDPTPAASRLESVALSGPRFSQLAEWLGGAELLWSEYVVRMNLDRQQAVFGTPFLNAWEAVRNSLSELTTGLEGGEVRFDGTAGAVVAVALLGLAALGWALRGLLARGWQRRRERQARAGAVRFWRRFLTLTARRGVRPETSETPAEFAARAAAALGDLFTGDLAGLPTTAAADLYAVRFGGATLPADRLTAALDQLEARLRGRS